MQSESELYCGYGFNIFLSFDGAKLRLIFETTK